MGLDPDRDSAPDTDPEASRPSSPSSSRRQLTLPSMGFLRLTLLFRPSR